MLQAIGIAIINGENMLIDVNVKTVCQIDIDKYEAFRVLCKTLDMDFIFNEDIYFFVRKDCYNNNCVYYIKDGHDELYDDRGDLFIALRNVAVNIFPNVWFRNDDYIYNK